MPELISLKDYLAAQGHTMTPLIAAAPAGGRVLEPGTAPSRPARAQAPLIAREDASVQDTLGIIKQGLGLGKLANAGFQDPNLGASLGYLGSAVSGAAALTKPGLSDVQRGLGVAGAVNSGLGAAAAQGALGAASNVAGSAVPYVGAALRGASALAGKGSDKQKAAALVNTAGNLAANILVPGVGGFVYDLGIGPMIDYAFVGNDITEMKRDKARAGAKRQMALENALYEQIAPQALANPERGFQMSPAQVRQYLVDAGMVEPSTIGAFGSRWTPERLEAASAQIARELPALPSLVHPEQQTGVGGLTPGTELSSQMVGALGRIPGSREHELITGGGNFYFDQNGNVVPLGVGGWQPEIPSAARGAIVDKPTLMLAGEAGPEAIVPLDPGVTPRDPRVGAMQDRLLTTTSANPGGGCLLASYALDAFGLGQDAPQRRFFQRLAKLFLARYPETGLRQLALYQKVATRILEHLDDLDVAAQANVQRVIYDEVIEPTGKTLEADEVDATRRRLVTVTVALARKFGIPLPVAQLEALKARPKTLIARAA
jgi:hypothetical protein